MTRLLFFIATISIFFIVSAAIAQPQIGGMSSSQLSDQGSYLINAAAGSSFGIGPIIFCWDDFESGSHGQPIPGNYPVITNGGIWLEFCNGPVEMPRYSTTRGYGSPQSASILYDGTICALNIYFGVTTGRFYQSWLVYHDPRRDNGTLDCEANPVNAKLMYTWTACDHESPQFMWYNIDRISRGYSPGDQAPAGNPCTSPYGVWYWGPPTWVQICGSWHRYESYWQMDSANGVNDGVLKAWIDNNMIVDDSGLNLMPSGCLVPDCWMTNVHIGDMWQGYANVDNPRRFYDDIYLSNSLARVEIGNNPTFDNCTSREIQIPDNWTSTQIQFTANQGLFSYGSPAYVFVVNSSGQASPGYLIHWGEGEILPCSD